MIIVPLFLSRVFSTSVDMFRGFLPISEAIGGGGLGGLIVSTEGSIHLHYAAIRAKKVLEIRQLFDIRRYIVNVGGLSDAREW